MIGNFGISKILLFHYKMGKFSSELHHYFSPDFSFPKLLSPPFLFFLNICKNKKNKNKTLESFSSVKPFYLSWRLYILVGMVHAIVRLWFFHIWLKVIIDLCYESFDHWNLLNHVILCDTKLLLSGAIVRRMVYEQYRGVLARSFHWW